ncbi:MAG: UPF0158 family protein [Solirubrobacteraceae bacterium]|jgi:hypothetical protein
MLDLDACLSDICIALEDHSDMHASWFDPATGEVELVDRFLDSEDDPEERGLLYVHPLDSGEAYEDLEEFVEQVADPRARDLLDRAISGRGAFRRFKDTLFEFPDLREAWFRFHDARMEHRAIEWLRDEELIDDEQKQRALGARPIPELGQPRQPPDARGIAGEVGRDLRELYGERLHDVILFGSHARGDAGPDSDIDLLVVLDELASRRLEIDRMNEVIWRHSLANDAVVTELPVSRKDWAHADAPLLVSARLEGVSVS